MILGADTRATSDTIVADKNCSKIHYLSPNIYCCGAGTAADTTMTTDMISAQLELHQLNTSRVPRVGAANQLLKQFLFRYSSANFICCLILEQQVCRYVGLTNSVGMLRYSGIRVTWALLSFWEGSTPPGRTSTASTHTAARTSCRTWLWALAVSPPWLCLSLASNRIWRYELRATYTLTRIQTYTRILTNISNVYLQTSRLTDLRTYNKPLT